jgi:hypothetical protein
MTPQPRRQRASVEGRDKAQFGADPFSFLIAVKLRKAASSMSITQSKEEKQWTT